MKIGLLICDIDEYRPFVEKTSAFKREKYDFYSLPADKFVLNGAEVITAVPGIGKVNAVCGTMFLINNGCDLIINFGYSGGLSGVKKGDTVICDRFVEHDFSIPWCEPFKKPNQSSVYYADKTFTEKLKSLLPDSIVGTAVTGDTFIADNEKANMLKKEFSAVSCDMETAAAAYTCNLTGTKFVCLRSISDDASSDAEESYIEQRDSGKADIFETVKDYLCLITK